MTQLILASLQEDGGYQIIAAIQNDDILEIPTLEWILQMKEHLEFLNDDVKFVILHREEFGGTIDDEVEDITALCEETFKRGKSCL